MATLHMTEAELAHDLHAVLIRVQQGVEVVIEHDLQPVAVLSQVAPRGRLLSECIALADSRGSRAVLDSGFMDDVAKGIGERSQSWQPPAWE